MIALFPVGWEWLGIALALLLLNKDPKLLVDDLGGFQIEFDRVDISGSVATLWVDLPVDLGDRELTWGDCVFASFYGVVSENSTSVGHWVFCYVVKEHVFILALGLRRSCSTTN